MLTPCVPPCRRRAETPAPAKMRVPVAMSVMDVMVTFKSAALGSLSCAFTASAIDLEMILSAPGFASAVSETSLKVRAPATPVVPAAGDG